MGARPPIIAMQSLETNVFKKEFHSFLYSLDSHIIVLPVSIMFIPLAEHL